MEKGPPSHKASSCPPHVKACRSHKGHDLPSHLSLDFSPASPTGRLPALLTHFSLISGRLDQTLQEEPAATRQPSGAGDSSQPPTRVPALCLLTPPQRRVSASHCRLAQAGGPILPQAGTEATTVPSPCPVVFMSLECANPGPM